MAFSRWGDSIWYVYPDSAGFLCCHYDIDHGYFFDIAKSTVESILAEVRKEFASAGINNEYAVDELRGILEENWQEITTYGKEKHEKEN